MRPDRAREGLGVIRVLVRSACFGIVLLVARLGAGSPTTRDRAASGPCPKVRPPRSLLSWRSQPAGLAEVRGGQRARGDPHLTWHVWGGRSTCRELDQDFFLRVWMGTNSPPDGRAGQVGGIGLGLERVADEGCVRAPLAGKGQWGGGVMGHEQGQR